MMQTATRQLWPQIQSLFDAALSLPRGQWESFVGANTSDPLLRDAVLSLLRNEAHWAANRNSGVSVDHKQAFNACDTLPIAPDSHQGSAAKFGNYTLRSELGRGGMGVVYLAEQAQPRRLVALKLITGEHDPHSLARFRREAELLARLAHPGIAQIIEAGSDSSGRPFLVMEYVDGQPLSVAAASLARSARLQLLARIAEAIDHAHSRGVVHRDLKPSNILVNASGQPKILDFGIAGITELGVEALTATGMLLGTPAYMSPEQARANSTIDARADVYALGVIAYELLCDRLPIPMAGLSPLQALQALSEQTPPPLSRIDQSLRGELETIVGKALAKEPELRYPNAGALADDLRRYLAHEPIQARRPGSWRRLQLFGRRNPLVLTLSVLSFLSLLGGLVVSLWFALGQARERQRSEAALVQAQATLGALRQIFSAGNPVLAGQPDVSFRAVLNSASSQPSQAPDQIRAEVLLALAEALSSLGEVETAEKRFAEVEQLAATLGERRLRLRAGLRHAMLLVEHVSPNRAEAFVERFLADPQTASDPLIHTWFLALHAQVAELQGRWQTTQRRLQAALRGWPVPAEASDTQLRHELEARLLLLRVPHMSADPIAYAQLAEQMQVAVARMTPSMGAEHPALVQMRILADAIPDSIAQKSTWIARLVAEIEQRVPELGPTHPAVLARLVAGNSMDSTLDPQLHRQRLQLTLAAVQALPAHSRVRTRIATGIARDGASTGLPGFNAGDFLQMHAAQCPESEPPDRDCVNLLNAAAQLLLREQRGDEAIALLQKQTRPAQASATVAPTLRFHMHQALARTLRMLKRFDAAADAADAAMAASLRIRNSATSIVTAASTTWPGSTGQTIVRVRCNTSARSSNACAPIRPPTSTA